VRAHLVGLRISIIAVKINTISVPALVQSEAGWIQARNRYISAFFGQRFSWTNFKAASGPAGSSPWMPVEM